MTEKTVKPLKPAETDLIELPVLPLRDVVVFPHMVIPLFVGREKSVRALDIAMEGAQAEGVPGLLYRQVRTCAAFASQFTLL